jgi:hypothetical protein
MAEEGCVHRAVDCGEIGRIDADYGGGELAESRSRALGMGREVRRSERADLAPALEAAVGHDAHERRGQPADHATARHDVLAVDVTQVVTEDVNARDRHRARAFMRP